MKLKKIRKDTKTSFAVNVKPFNVHETCTDRIKLIAFPSN